jgi:Ca2+-binding EF-hand superfamily protein
MPEALDIKKIDKNSDGLIDKKELADLAKKVKKPEIKKELATKLNLEENLQLKELVLKTLELVVSQIKQKKDTEYEN